jgi:hypothetical protein
VQVYRDEGVAIRISPEPCMAVREGRGEASVGKTCKPAIVPRKSVLNQDADGDGFPEGHTCRRVNASAEMILRGQRTWRVWKPLVREPGEITADQQNWPASGRHTRRSR